LVLVATLLTTSISGAVWLTHASGEQWVAAQLDAQLQAALREGDADLGSVRLDGVRRLHIDDVVIRDASGEPALTLGEVTVDLDVWGLLRGRGIGLKEVSVREVTVHTELLDDGSLAIAHLFVDPNAPVDPDAPPFELPVPVSIDRLLFEDVSVEVRSTQGVLVAGIDRWSLDASVRGAGRHIVLDLHGSEAQLSGPADLPLTMSGTLELEGERLAVDQLRAGVGDAVMVVQGQLDAGQVAVSIDIEALQLSTFDDLAGAPGLAGALRGTVEVTGPQEDLVLQGLLEGREGARGTVRLDGRADVRGAVPVWSLTTDLQDLHVVDWLPTLGDDDPVFLDGVLTLEGIGAADPDNLKVEARYTARGAQRVYGSTVEGLDVALTYEDGRLHVRPTTLNGFIGVLEASGEIRLDGEASVLHIQGVLTPERLAELGVEGVVGEGRLDLRVTGKIDGSDAPVQVRGEVTYERLGYGSDVSVRDVRVGVDVVVRGQELDGDLTLETGVAVAYGVVMGPTQTLRLTLTRQASGALSMQGETTLTYLEMEQGLRSEASQASWHMTMSESGEVVAGLDSVLGELLLLDFHSRSGVLGVSMEGSKVVTEVRLDGEGWTLLDMQASYDLQTGLLNVHRFEGAPTSRNVWSGTDLSVRTIEGGVEDVSIALTSSLGSLKADGRFSTSGALEGTVEVSGFALDLISEWGGADVPELAGQADVRVAVSGTMSSPKIEVAGTLADVWVGNEVHGGQASGTVAVDEQGLTLDLRMGSMNHEWLRAQGTLPVALKDGEPVWREDEADVRCVLRSGDVSDWREVLPMLEDLPPMRGSGELRWTGPMMAPTVHWGSVVEMEVPGWSDLARLELTLTHQEEGWTYWGNLLEGLSPRVTIRGRADARLDEVLRHVLLGEGEVDTADWNLYASALNADLVMDNLGASNLAKMMGLEGHVGGRVQGELKLIGTPYRPVVGGKISWEEGVVGTVGLDTFQLTLLPAIGGYSVDMGMIFAEQGDLSIQGSVPLTVDLKQDMQTWMAGAYDVTIGGTGIPLALLTFVDEGLRQAGGLLEIEGTIGGTSETLQPDLSLRMDKGTVVSQSLGLRITDAALDAKLTDTHAILHRFEATTSSSRASGPVEGESSFIAHGGAILDGWTPQKIHGRIELKNGTLVSATPELRLRLDGNLEVEGDLDLLVVTGDLDLAQGRVVLDAASFLEVAPLSLDPRLQVERGVVRTLQVDRSDQDVDLRMLDVDVAVDLGRNLELDLSMPFLDDYGSFGRLVGRLDLDARLGGEMNVGVSEGDVSLVGELDIHDGLLGVLRSRFDLESSTITFVGGDYSEPALNIAAKMDTGADVVELKVSGTPSYPDISFTSETLADENEILLTLITGRAPSDLDTTQAQGATSALAGLVLNSLLGGAGSFSIEPDGSIRAGIPVSPDLYATTLAHPTPEAGENAFTVIIDWSLAPRLVASTGLGDQRQSADLYWEHRF
jgi:autotransporter translocation and assembly factor TamB